ncbi:MAG: hypothetical protein ACTHU1_13555 [Arachnia sp.]
MSGLLRCGRCERKLFDPRPPNRSGPEHAAEARERQRQEERDRNNDPTGVTAAEVIAQLDRANKRRPSGEALAVEHIQDGRKRPRGSHAVWAARGGDALLVMECPNCQIRYAITDTNMRRRVAEAIKHNRDVILTNRDR